MLCPSCNGENPASNAFCGRCGAALPEVRPDAASSDHLPPPRYGDSGRTVRREIAVVVGGVSLLLLAGWVAWYLLIAARSPDSVVRQFIELDRSGQYAKQQELITSGWDSRMALSLFQSVRRQAGASPFEKYRIVRTSQSRSPNAYVDVELTLPQPSIPLLTPPASSASGNQPPTTTVTVTFILTRERDEWKIESGQTLSTVLGELIAKGFQQFQSLPSLPGIQIPPGWPYLGHPPPSPPSYGPGSSPQPGSSPTF